ncbi:MAG: alkaline phosphatase family protein [Vicinamibacterales bacterium]
MRASALTFLFVDGLGLTDDRHSPLRSVRLPTLERLTNGFSTESADGSAWAYRVLDATLDVAGLPQSATGQTALLTGVNAAALLGRHQGPHPGSRLQRLLADESVHMWAARRGRRVFHANGYRAEYLQRVMAARRNMLSAFAFAARAAGNELLDIDDVRAHRPGFWSEPSAAGRALAAVAGDHHLTVLEYWALDYSGHREREAIQPRLEELDAFVSGYLEAAGESTLIITSDHGNAEESWHARHTRNPVPFVAIGPAAHTVPSMRSLVDVAGWMKGAIG